MIVSWLERLDSFKRRRSSGRSFLGSSMCLWLGIGVLVGLMPGIFIGFSNTTLIQEKLMDSQKRKISSCDPPYTPNNKNLETNTSDNANDVLEEIELVATADENDDTVSREGEGKEGSKDTALKNELPLTHPSWCPPATCTNTDLCKPCQRRFLLVVATPRSASTTLTWMLNELPGIRMSGENNNQLAAILQMKNNVWNHSSFQHGNDQKNAWGHNYIPHQNFACAAQATMEAINPPPLVDKTVIKDKESEKHDIIGFKTIRFERGDDQHIVDMVDHVKENFPCSRVVINISSNVTRQAESFKNANFFHISAHSLQNRNNKLKWIKDLFGDQAVLLDSAKWTTNLTMINDVVDWLGFDQTCRFKELLKFNTQGHGFQNEHTELSYRDPSCHRI